MWYQYFLLYFFLNAQQRDFVRASPLTGHNVRLAKENEFPFIAALLRRTRIVIPERDIICTASLISTKDILTAEHCLEYEVINGINIIIGSIDISFHLKYYPAWWITYDQWAETNNIKNVFTRNDICLIRLNAAVTTGVLPAKISYIPYTMLVGKKVVSSGWGEINNGTLPRILHTTKLKILENENCEARISALDDLDLYIERNLLCATASPFVILMCGDSGGPLLYGNKIIAISTGTCPLPQQSFHPDKVNIFTNLRPYKKFMSDIKNVI